jgi:hypothetical protein
LAVHSTKSVTSASSMAATARSGSREVHAERPGFWHSRCNACAEAGPTRGSAPLVRRSGLCSAPMMIPTWITPIAGPRAYRAPPRPWLTNTRPSRNRQPRADASSAARGASWPVAGESALTNRAHFLSLANSPWRSEHRDAGETTIVAPVCRRMAFRPTLCKSLKIFFRIGREKSESRPSVAPKRSIRYAWRLR